MALTRKTAEQFKLIQRAMKRIILGITLNGKIHNNEILNETKVSDIIQIILSLKWQWIGHMCRQDDDR